MIRSTASMAVVFAVITVALLLPWSGASARTTKTVTGVVKNAITEAPLAGVIVQDVKAGNSALTDAEGRFTLEADAYDYTITAWHPDYTVPIRWRPEIDVSPTMPDFCLYPESVIDRITDKFDRADGAVLGSTEDSYHLPWLAGDLRSNAAISGGTLLLPRQAETGDGASIGGDFLPGDLDMTVTINGIVGTNIAAICYRQNPQKGTGGKAQFGFWMALFMYADGRKITNGQYWYGSPVLVKEYVPPEPVDWRMPHTVRIKAQRYHQQVWLDGKEIMNYFCWFDQTYFEYSEGTAALPVGGYVGIYRGPDTAVAVDAVDIQVLGPAPDADEQRVANLEEKYRKSGAYAEGAGALDDLARTFPGSKLAALAYIGEAKLMLESGDTGRALYPLQQATRQYKLGGAVSLGVDELLVMLREKATAANNDKDREAVWRALYQCEMSPVRKYYSLLMAVKAL